MCTLRSSVVQPVCMSYGRAIREGKKGSTSSIWYDASPTALAPTAPSLLLLICDMLFSNTIALSRTVEQIQCVGICGLLSNGQFRPHTFVSGGGSIGLGCILDGCLH